MDLSIGDLSGLTGVPVKTIRYYSDLGLVPEARRTDAGYRRYDDTAVALLGLVRALRELGLDLEATRRVASRRMTVSEVAAAQAEAIDVRIHQLQLRRRALRAIARGASRPEEVQRMSAFARASADEVNRTMEDFLAAVFSGHESNPFAATMRGALPVLPDDPSDAQVDAWIELAALVGDAGFRNRVHEMVAEGHRLRAASGLNENDAATQDAGRAVVERAGRALADGVDPASDAASAVVDGVVAMFAAAAGRADDGAYRTELAAQLERFSDVRVERYWQLIALINGWPAQAPMVPAYAWFIAALRVSRTA